MSLNENETVTNSVIDPIADISTDDHVPFTYYTPHYGRAEFRFCLHDKRGKLDCVFIHPQQQPDLKTKFRLKSYSQQTFSVMSWTYRGINNPYIWRHFWCQEHKGPAFDLYVPDNSTHFEVHGSNIYFSY